MSLPDRSKWAAEGSSTAPATVPLGLPPPRRWRGCWARNMRHGGQETGLQCKAPRAHTPGQAEIGKASNMPETLVRGPTRSELKFPQTQGTA